MTGKAFTACLWADTEGEAAPRFYAGIFKDCELGRADGALSAEAGNDMLVTVREQART